MGPHSKVNFEDDLAIYYEFKLHCSTLSAFFQPNITVLCNIVLCIFSCGFTIRKYF